jgi:hypothetical protein
MKRAILLSLIIVLLAVVGWILPNYLPARLVSARSACISNLEHLQRLKKEWAAKNQKSGNDIPTEQDLFGKDWEHRTFKCPTGADYRIGAVKEFPICSFGSPEHSLPARR